MVYRNYTLARYWFTGIIHWNYTLDGLRALPIAFQELVAKRHHIALVVGEFGGTADMLTMADVVATLLGLETVDEAHTREDIQVFARALWKKSAAAMESKTESEARSE